MLNTSFNIPWIRSCVISTLILLLSACQDKVPEPPPSSNLMGTAIQIIRPPTVSDLRESFREMSYDWSDLTPGVPPIILETFPTNFDTPLNIRQRKNIFFMSLLPLVLLTNQEILRERQTLNDLLEHYNREKTLPPEDAEWLSKLARKYRLRGDPLIDQRMRTILLRRVDTLPPSLVLAQAANESAWGTSRFAREGNNMFGQWTFTPGAGIIPKNRPEGAIYEVRRFQNLLASVRGYFNNINTHSAYLELRKTRFALRKQNRPVTGRALAMYLDRYSTRGFAYVREIQAMIDHNNLSRINDVVLNGAPLDHTLSPGEGGSGLLSSRSQLTQQSVALAEKPRVD